VIEHLWCDGNEGIEGIGTLNYYVSNSDEFEEAAGIPFDIIETCDGFWDWRPQIKILFDPIKTCEGFWDWRPQIKIPFDPLMIIWIWREKEKILRSQIKTETTKRNTIETLVILNLEREGENPEIPNWW